MASRVFATPSRRRPHGRVNAAYRPPAVTLGGQQPLDRAELLRLGQTSGNRAVAGMLQRANARAGTAAGTASLQRAVGLEFQTYKGTTKIERETDAGWQVYADDIKERYAQGNGIKVEKDGKDLEFITNAFEESDAGRAALTSAMRAMVLTALALEGRITLTSDLPTVSGLDAGPNARPAVRVSSPGTITASPHATAGVRLDRISALVAQLSAGGKRPPEDGPRPHPRDGGSSPRYACGTGR